MTKEEAIENLEILKEDYWDDDGYGHETKQYNDTMCALDMAIKALEQEPRKGHWMGDSYGYICSNCEHSLNDLAQSMDYIPFRKPKYCPNCGVAMGEGEG